MKAPRHWPLCGEFTGEFPPQMGSNAENVPIWWRHHDHRILFRITRSLWNLTGVSACILLWDLSYRVRVTHKHVSRLCRHWFGQWLAACLTPSHHLSQCWLIVNWNLKKKFVTKMQQLSYKKITLKMSSPKWWSFCSGLNVLNALEKKVEILFVIALPARCKATHYSDVTMGVLASQITGDSSVCLTVCF